MLSETPEKLGLPNLAVIHVETDYRKRFEELKKTVASEREHLNKLLTSEFDRFKETTQQRQVQTRQNLRLTQQRQAIEQQIATVQHENTGLRLAVSKLERDVKIHQAARMDAEAERERAQKESIGNLEQNDRIWMEKELKSSRDELEGLPARVRAIEAIQREKKDLQERLNASVKHTQGLHKDLSATQQRKQRMVAQSHQMASLDQYRAVVAKRKHILKDLEREISSSSKEVTRWKKKYRHCDSSVPKELASLQKQVVAREKEAKELIKWQKLVRQHEHEAQEVTRWTNLHKKSLNREKLLENELNDLKYWKQRALMLEKDSQELKAWKLNIQNNNFHNVNPSSQTDNRAIVASLHGGGSYHSNSVVPDNTDHVNHSSSSQPMANSGGSQASLGNVSRGGYLRSNSNNYPNVSSHAHNPYSHHSPTTTTATTASISSNQALLNTLHSNEYMLNDYNTSAPTKSLSYGNFSRSTPWAPPGPAQPSTNAAEFFGGGPLFQLGNSSARVRSSSFDNPRVSGGHGSNSSSGPTAQNNTQIQSAIPQNATLVLGSDESSRDSQTRGRNRSSSFDYPGINFVHSLVIIDDKDKPTPESQDQVDQTSSTSSSFATRPGDSPPQKGGGVPRAKSEGSR